jgi:hypothetical protein
MSRLILFFQSKVALAVIGAVLCGGGAALVAAVPFSGFTNHAAPQQPQSFASIAAIGTGTATPAARTPGSSPTPGGSPTPGKSPTATPTPRPPTPTPTPKAGQAGSVRGTVTNVNTNTSLFAVRVFTGATTTVVVNSQTTFQGACTSLSGLHAGWSVTVQGVYQADGSLLANAVHSDD